MGDTQPTDAPSNGQEDELCGRSQTPQTAFLHPGWCRSMCSPEAMVSFFRFSPPITLSLSPWDGRLPRHGLIREPTNQLGSVFNYKVPSSSYCWPGILPRGMLPFGTVS